MDFEEELKTLINRCSKENESNTPDFILAQYLKDEWEEAMTISKPLVYWFYKKTMDLFVWIWVIKDYEFKESWELFINLK